MNKVISMPKAAVRRAEAQGKAARLTGTIQQLVGQLRPSLPLYVLKPDAIAENARQFAAQFPGTVMFAVKSNPDKAVIQALSRGGLKSFDCASIDEIRMIRKTAPKAKIFFMHPVKSREAIREAYDVHGVRAFSLDTIEELYKIIQETSYAPDLELFVRIATPSKGKAVIPLSRKFGANYDDAVELLEKCRPVAARLGLAFHVGFQCMDPKQYRKALQLCANLIRAARVKVDAIDVGGGFPSAFVNLSPPERMDYMMQIIRAVKDFKLGGIELFAEPGQALVANAGHLVARVELRKGDTLYLNDGVFGSLHDAAKEVGLRHPVEGVNADRIFSKHLTGFQMAGPTCTTEDMMPGPYFLPSDINEGDWVAFSNIGAYSQAFRTNFNGFGACHTVLLYDEKHEQKIKQI